jgi:hypothetical protein
MIRKIKLGEDDGAFDADFWAQFSPEERLEAVWQATLDWAAMKGLNEDKLRLQRTVVGIKRG